MSTSTTENRFDEASFSYRGYMVYRYSTGTRGGISECIHFEVGSLGKIPDNELKLMVSDLGIKCGSPFEDKEVEITESEGYQNKTYYKYHWKYSPSTE